MSVKFMGGVKLTYEMGEGGGLHKEAKSSGTELEAWNRPVFVQGMSQLKSKIGRMVASGFFCGPLTGVPHS